MTGESHPRNETDHDRKTAYIRFRSKVTDLVLLHWQDYPEWEVESIEMSHFDSGARLLICAPQGGSGFISIIIKGIDGSSRIYESPDEDTVTSYSSFPPASAAHLPPDEFAQAVEDRIAMHESHKAAQLDGMPISAAEVDEVLTTIEQSNLA